MTTVFFIVWLAKFINHDIHKYAKCNDGLSAEKLMFKFFKLIQWFVNDFLNSPAAGTVLAMAMASPTCGNGRRAGAPAPPVRWGRGLAAPVVPPYAAAAGKRDWARRQPARVRFPGRPPWIAQVVEQPSHQRSVAGSTPAPAPSATTAFSSTPPVAVAQAAAAGPVRSGAPARCCGRVGGSRSVPAARGPSGSRPPPRSGRPSPPPDRRLPATT